MIYYEIQKSIIEGNAQDTVKIVKDAIAKKYPPEKILQKGLIRGIDLVAEKFKTEMVLIPEVLMSTRAMNAGLSILKPELERKSNKPQLKILMGVVSGDLHDIGKNIVKAILSTLDVEIIDLGINVSKEVFTSKVESTTPDILIISALLTTTIPEVKLIIEELKNNNLRDKITVFIGGGPMSEPFRKKSGADYYIPDVIELRDFISKNMCKFRK